MLSRICLPFGVPEITPVFDGVRVAYSLVLYVVSCVLLFVCLPFTFLGMALSVYFRFMSLTVALVNVVVFLDVTVNN